MSGIHFDQYNSSDNTPHHDRWTDRAVESEEGDTNGPDFVNRPQQVDLVPTGKEISQVLAQSMSYLVSYMHGRHWTKFEDYATSISRKYPGNYDIEALLLIYQSDELRMLGQAPEASCHSYGENGHFGGFLMTPLTSSLSDLERSNLKVRHIMDGCIS